MYSADQIIIHLVGDFITQSHWMATEKTKRWLPAAAHALVYSAGFLVFRPSLAAWLVIAVSHYLIDRYRIARYVVWLKNLVFAPPLDCLEVALAGWPAVTATGYPDAVPLWLSVWLLIIADNVIHILINGAALKFL